MSGTAAAFCDAPTSERRIQPSIDTRRLFTAARFLGDGIIIGVGSVAAIGLLAGAVTLSAVWMVNTAISANPHIRTQGPRGPEALALVRHAARMTAAVELSAPVAPPVAVAAAPEANFDAKWSRVMAYAPAGERVQAPRELVAKATVTAPKIAAEQPSSIPLPRPHPAPREIASVAPIEFVGPPMPQPQQVAAKAPAAPQQVAAVAPPTPVTPTPEKRIAPQPVHNKSMALPDADSRTAVYDISARTVYMPSGKRLEAHSGLGEKMDDPRHVHVRMRGATPPNVYQLTMREKLFHGVRAIRLNPVDQSKMFGRDGILAHSYMLGPNGQSNGCVSFKDYDAFLNAYLNGEVDRIVVVSNMGDAPPALTAKVRRGPISRYAASMPTEPPSFTAQ